MADNERDPRGPFPSGCEGPRTGVRLDEDAYINLLVTHAVLEHPMARLFADHDISGPLYNVLRAVRRAGHEGIPTRRIPEQMATRDPDVTRLVDRLERAGLVRRERCKKDRRVVWVIVTPKGEAKLEEVEPLVLALHEQQFAHMKRAELRELNRLLERARAPHE